jgi:serine/threonine-protein kinase RsbW
VRWQPLASDVTLRATSNVTIRNDFAELPLLRDAVDDLARRHAIPGRAVMQLQVALDEIVSNAIKYAWPEGGQHQIHVRISVFSDRVELEVMDDGLSFDLRQTPELHRPAPGTRRRPGGVGVHLVRQLMDTIEYRRSDGCNHVLLTKRCAVGVYASEQ